MAPRPPDKSLDRAARERVAALAAMYQEAVAELSRIERRLRAGSYSRRYLVARLNEARAIIDGLMKWEDGTASGSVIEWARVNFPRTYEMGAGIAVSDLRLQGLAPIAGDMRIHNRAVEMVFQRFLTDTTELIVQINTNLIRTSRVVLAQAGFANEIATGIIGGLPRRQVSRSLERSLRKAVMQHVEGVTEGMLTHVDIGKRRWRIEAWAEMHARTATAEASTAGIRVLTAMNGVEHVQVTAHAHEPCICTPYEGRIYRLHQDRGDMRFPWIGSTPNGGPPFHPNCVHRLGPAVIELMEERGDLAGRTTLPEPFRGLSERELAQLVRANRDRLARYSRRPNGILPETFTLEAA